MQFQSCCSTLNARMYLYDTPRDTMAKDPMLQSLCSTSTWNSQELYAQKKCKFSCAPKPLSQHKSCHQSCASQSKPNTKHFIKHALQGPHPAQNIYIHIYHQQLAYAQYTKQIIMFICSGVFDPKIKHQYNHHDQ